MMKMIRYVKLVLLVCAAAALLLAGGCKSSYDPTAFHVFYLNENVDGLVPKEYDLNGQTQEAQVQELLQVLSTDTGRLDHVCPISNGVEVTSYEYSDGYLWLYFNAGYEKMNNVEEVLCRSAVVKTLCQLEEITGVGFFVDNKPLTGMQGETIGVMNNDSFVDNPGEDIQNIQETEIALYFATADGKKLAKEVQEVHYSSNMSVEKVIIERLLKGPETDGAMATIPEGTKLINISVLDGICVVNFDDGFLNHNYEIPEEIVIYSIVDSLTELDTIKTVQISVNGETNRVYRDKFSLSEQYQRKMDLVELGGEQKDVEVVDVAPEKGGVLNNITE